MVINIKKDIAGKKLNLTITAKYIFANKWTVVAMSMLTCLEVNMFTKIANNSFYFSIFSPFPILKITLQLDI